ncbi:hypothetical protein CEXT_737561 [Caerostris extrusa]|uniref:Uncharacterized protein n=1 Tax=Caerostris extrusa TaxID=172846 RepID=A0AAV4P6Q6_CAEEX|nr:hypothetical protein CEXT_737561 [Caerostris extrusa]
MQFLNAHAHQQDGSKFLMQSLGILHFIRFQFGMRNDFYRRCSERQRSNGKGGRRDAKMQMRADDLSRPSLGTPAPIMLMPL